MSRGSKAETQMQQLERQKLIRKPGVFAWLGAFAVVLLQLQLASHLTVDHADSADLGDVCEVCLKLDAKGTVPDAAQPFVAVPREQSAPAALAIAAALPSRTATRSARAPPRA